MTGEAWGPTVVPLAFGLAASAATLLGGLLALRLAQRIVLVLGLTAGIVLGVALFDLLPEALAMAAPGRSARATFGWVAAGIGGYMLFTRMLGGIRAAERWRAHLGPATLTLHSLVDGLGIGLAFHVSPQIGGVVALAVLTHDVADGVNVVGLSLAAERGHRQARAARGWLVANGVAPLLGVAAGLVLRVPAALLAPLMGVFAGGFLYIGACELVPRSHALDPRWRTTASSLAGIALMFAVSGLAR
ncbi:MAG: ZIP family metal transporter [Janthinobacterium lividum]